MASLVHVTDMTNSRSFAINGEPLSVKHALADFYNIAESAVQAKIANKTVRIVNRGPVTDLTATLAPNDTVTIFEAEVARGGVKGAFRS